MQNIFKQLDANAPSHMNAFDLSQRHIMSTKVGLKNVVCAIDTLPKDYFECDFLSLIRSMPINTAAFSRLKVTFDAVFVPYQQLWHGWNQFFLQTEERMSVGDSFDHTQIPRVSLNTLIYSLQNSIVSDALLLWVNKFKNDPAFYELNYDRNVKRLISSVISRSLVGSYPLVCFDDFGYSRGYNVCRFLDQLGYGSFYRWYKYSVDEVFNTIVSTPPITYTPVGGDKAVINFDSTSTALYNNIDNGNFLFYNFLTTVNAIGTEFVLDTVSVQDFNYTWDDIFDTVGCLYDITLNTSRPGSYKFTVRQIFVSPFRALAYQKAWQDYTMNKRQQAYDPSYFNVDHLDVINDFDTLLKIFSFHYDNWDYDLFTGVFNSPQTGDVSLLNNNVSIFFKSDIGAPHSGEHYVGTSETTTLDSGKEYKLGIRTIDGNDKYYNPSNFVVKPAVSVYDIKRAEFLQRWKENHLRAGNKLRNQAIGQWNTSFKYMSDEYCDMITSWEMPVNIDEVINTGNNQGDISGKGIGTSNGHFTYRCDDAGVILIFVSVKPRAEYDALMIDKQNTCLEIGDFPSPFFDNLGFESVPNYLLNFNKKLFGSDPTDIKNTPSTLGYTVRYAPWKTAIDKVHGSLMSYGYGRNGAGDLAIWNTPRRDIEQLDNYDDITTIFYVNPNIVDTIFGVAADGSLDSDHFILNCNLICKVIRNLSVSGQLMFGL